MRCDNHIVISSDARFFKENPVFKYFLKDCMSFPYLKLFLSNDMEFSKTVFSPLHLVGRCNLVDLINFLSKIII
jgi:hypothetical protein